MQVIITHGTFARSRVLQFSRLQLILVAMLLSFLLVLLSGAIYHFIFLKAAREGWPVVGQVLRLVERDELAQRDRYMRANLDAMAQKVGEMQAKLVRLDAMGERVSSLAGLKPEELRALQSATSPASSPAAGKQLDGGKGGPYVPIASPSLEQLNQIVSALDEQADQGSDLFTLAESRLMESRLHSLMVPSSAPVEGPVGSGFGFRSDPFTGHTALHTGLDFPAEVGTPIMAAAGGVVIAAEVHPQYGQMVELDHGNGLVTRYAHASRLLVKQGDIIKRGQRIALVGTTGRSTGPHLHFEVLVEGVPQNPAKFLAGRGGAGTALARAASAS
ncbi:MAG TPA: M23 family metallopeptidase [Methylibium sp.]